MHSNTVKCTQDFLALSVSHHFFAELVSQTQEGSLQRGQIIEVILGAMLCIFSLFSSLELECSRESAHWRKAPSFVVIRCGQERERDWDSFRPRSLT